MAGQAVYTSNYWDGAFLAPAGLLSKEIHTQMTPEKQWEATLKLLEFLDNTKEGDIGFLAGTKTPAPGSQVRIRSGSSLDWHRFSVTL